jgi:hypothetical protein
MRTTELEAQIQEIETKLAKLTGSFLDELWIMVPIHKQPAPPQEVVDKWMQTLGLTHAKGIALPGRHTSLTAVALTPGCLGPPQPDGWTYVALKGGAPATEPKDAMAWYHPTLALLYSTFLTHRDG